MTAALGAGMRALLLLTSVAATVAAAEPTRLLGFVTVDGRDPLLACEREDQVVARLSLSDGAKTVVTPLTCAAAPALAFAVEVPEGTWRLAVAPAPPAAFKPFTAPRALVMAGGVVLVTLDVGRRTVSARASRVAAPVPVRVAGTRPSSSSAALTRGPRAP